MNIALTPITSWQDELKNAITCPEQLLKELELPDSLLAGAKLGEALFSLRVPRPYLSRIEKGNPNDPLLRQILPLQEEASTVPGYVSDPLAENSANPQSGLIHKYKNRVLLIMSGACAINCRYCFRRHFAYDENQIGRQQWASVLAYLKNNPQVNEVILSGGDPLATSDQRLLNILADLNQLPQLTRLRIHTRLPVVIPQRITNNLLTGLQGSRLNVVMVLHINHPNEIDDAVIRTCQRIKSHDITLLNQAVLLKGINDDVSVQKTLSERLFAASILPYYLFLFDKVAGAAHFDLEESVAKELVGKLQAELPGYLVPRLAREIPGKPAKTLLAPLLNT
ncbi:MULTISPECIES: EF-P beta-lysylation protein EpmB [Nitrincola]|uniref:L-lysine 2,3-aminomutase n=1 Tax=Nitrincola nitratireducens TaxID=1229521 RepID=W9VFK7_9GAMM|nr:MULTISPECIES: EF-P beta-lysylation protein EpmB [Nitrincola]EXJ09465.1 L-lysine 2,3-aminomutase [Nitrincola nitratireducens]